MNIPTLSIYIHVPFCSKKCSYCAFYSRCPVAGEEEAFIRKILAELSETLEILNPVRVPTVFVGGGTPTVLRADLLGIFLDGVNRLLPSAPDEWTIEANPESLTGEHLDVFLQNGINRLSLGIQSFDSDTLATLGRGAGPVLIARALDRIAGRWTGQWNADLICEVPGQTADQALADVAKLASWNPDHVSLYTLTLEEGSPLEARINRGELTGKTDPEIWDLAAASLEAFGYGRYEISNFSKKGKECLHNLGYWKMDPFLGVGPSAASTLPGENGPVRIINRPDLGAYLNASHPRDHGEQESLGYADFFMEFLLMGFRLLEGIPRERIRSVFGFPLEEMLPDWTAANLASGRLAGDKGVWRLLGRGLDFMDSLLLDAGLEADKIESRLSTPESPLPKIHWPGYPRPKFRE